jgi:hypothetical protein
MAHIAFFQLRVGLRPKSKSNAYAGSEPNAFTHLRKTFLFNSQVTGSWSGRTPAFSHQLDCVSLNSRLKLHLGMTYLQLMKHLNWVSIKPPAHPNISFFAGFFRFGQEVAVSGDARRVLHRFPR